MPKRFLPFLLAAGAFFSAFSVLADDPPAAILTLPPKPAGLTVRPSIKVRDFNASSSLAKKLDVDALKGILTIAVGNDFEDSERFTLSDSDQPDCYGKITLHELYLNQLATTNITPLSKLAEYGSRWIPGLGHTIATNIDFSRSELALEVRVSLSIEVFETAAGARIAQGTGQVNWSDKTGTIALDVAGLTIGKNQGAPIAPGGIKDNITFQGRILELAGFRAVSNMLPKIDHWLSLPHSESPAEGATVRTATPSFGLSPKPIFKPAPAAPPTAAVASPPAPSSAPVPEHPKFCSNCGHAVKPGDKFCPDCGHALKE